MLPSSFAKATAAVIATSTLVLLNLGGCKVTSEPHDPGSTKVAEVLNHGGQFDLVAPPSRDDAGMSAGQTNVTYQRSDHKPFHVVVLLPMGKQIDVDARLLTFDSLAEADPTSASPTTMDIHLYPATLEEGRDVLLSAARQFGFESGAVDEWYDTAKSPTTATDPIRTAWLAATVGYLRVSVQATYKPPVDSPESDQIEVHYLLTWGQGT